MKCQFSFKSFQFYNKRKNTKKKEIKFHIQVTKGLKRKGLLI